jgi:hypothetical protein
MFNNANVIFRTKFVDGVSTVARTIGTGSSTASGGKGRRGASGALSNSSQNRVDVDDNESPPARKRPSSRRSRNENAAGKEK